MFTGHAAIALFAKRARPTLPLWLLIAAAYASDGIELLANLARLPDDRMVAMLSHSIVGDLAFATLLGVTWWLFRRDGAGALLLGATLVSHWPADFLTGQRKPTWPGGPEGGLFLYRYDLLDFLIEGTLLVAVWMALRAMPGRRTFGKRIALALPLLLLPVQATYNVLGHRGHWDWKKVMLRGSRATARRVRDGVTLVIPETRAPAGGASSDRTS
jgi:hypothetical protein